MAVKKCEVCGKEFDANLDKTVCCSKACYTKRWRKTHPKQKEVNTKKEKCIICGTEFIPLREGHICFSRKCSVKRNQMVSSEQKKQRYAEEQQIKRARKAMPKSNHDKIADIAIAARNEGLSYGQYVAKYMGKF